VSSHRLCNAAQRWHKGIYTAIATLILGDELDQSKHNLCWLLCGIASLHWILSRNGVP